MLLIMNSHERQRLSEYFSELDSQWDQVLDLLNFRPISPLEARYKSYNLLDKAQKSPAFYRKSDTFRRDFRPIVEIPTKTAPSTKGNQLRARLQKLKEIRFFEFIERTLHWWMVQKPKEEITQSVKEDSEVTPYNVTKLFKSKFKIPWKAYWDPCILARNWNDIDHHNFLLNSYAKFLTVINPPFKIKAESLLKSVTELGKGRSSVTIIPSW